MTDSRDEHEPYGITPPVKDSDIVPWLRCESDAAANHPPPWLMLSAAADAIARLTAERDEARREALLWVKERCSWAELAQEIKKRGWEYLKEDSK
jgi:hypothetical protein